MTKPELIARGIELGIDVEPLANNDERAAAIAKREAELEAEKKTAKDPEAQNDESKKDSEDTEAADEKEADSVEEGKPGQEAESPQPTIAESEDESEEDQEAAAEADKEAEEEAAGIYTDPRGIKWSFKKNAPKTINLDGVPRTQQEILDDESLIGELVYGNNTYLTQHL